MSRASLPKEGCFRATYPGTTWEEVPCVPPSPNFVPLIPGMGGTAKAGSEIVGLDGVDDTAVLASNATISWAEGSFPSVVGVTSLDSSAFSLQLNSSYISYSNQSSSPCAGGLASCQGWAQFVYSSGTVWMQYWLVNYGTCTDPTNSTTCTPQCQTPWANAPITEKTSKYYKSLGCVINTNAMTVSPRPAATDLSRITLTGTTGSGGDSVLMTVGGTIYAHGQAGNPVLLSSYWNTAEFNIFGYGNGAGYSFVENNVSLVAQILTDSATTSAAPTCGGKTFTGESNNLTLVPSSCCPIAGTTGTTPGIQFMESNLSSPTKQSCPLFAADPNWTAISHPFDAIITGTDAGGAPLYSCKVNYQGGFLPGKTRADWQWCDIGNGSQELWLNPYETLVAGWVDENNGNVPSNALPFGTDGTNGPTLYACRAYLDYDGFQVGKVRPGLGACDIGYAGQEHWVTHYQVLTSTVPLTIQTVNSTTPPSGALVGGYDSNNAPLVVCQAQYGGGLVPGKVPSGWSSCVVPYGGSEQYVSTYNVLVPTFKSPPGTVFKAGTQSNGNTLGICHASYQNSTQVGMYLTSSKACNFGYGGSDVSLTSGYQVLSK